jgi:hypothetical protein
MLAEYDRGCQFTTTSSLVQWLRSGHQPSPVQPPVRWLYLAVRVAGNVNVNGNTNSGIHLLVN